MKIKLLKDIPAYKKDEILELGPTVQYGMFFMTNRWVTAKSLISDGFAEEVKDEIDMEQFRKNYDHSICSKEEQRWFGAYRIVKAVIDTLNGDWNMDWSSVDNYLIRYNHLDHEFYAAYFSQPTQGFLLPYMKDRKTAEKVIKLCGPELKILFNIKD